MGFGMDQIACATSICYPDQGSRPGLVSNLATSLSGGTVSEAYFSDATCLYPKNAKADRLDSLQLEHLGGSAHANSAYCLVVVKLATLDRSAKNALLSIRTPRTLIVWGTC